MTNHKDKSNSPGQARLDDQLDTALAKYAAVEPRAGLEQRILANLKAQQERTIGAAWWRWAALVVAALVTATLVFWKWEAPRRSRLVQLPSNRQELPNKQVRPPSKNSKTESPALRRPSPHRSHPLIEAPAQPRLEQFPSPQPLNEQEKILADYVAQFHRQAVLIARLKNQELQQDRMDIIGKSRLPAEMADDRGNETTNR